MPAFTSAAAATATIGQAFTFTVTTVGSPTSYTTTMSHRGTLPAGVTFTNNGNGTATLTGTPTAAGGGSTRHVHRVQTPAAPRPSCSS